MTDTAPTNQTNPQNTPTQAQGGNFNWDNVIEDEVKRQLAAQEADIKADSEKLLAKAKQPSENTTQAPQETVSLKEEVSKPKTISPTQPPAVPTSTPAPATAPAPAKTQVQSPTQTQDSIPQVREEKVMKPLFKPEQKPSGTAKSVIKPSAPPSEKVIETTLSPGEITETSLSLDPLQASVENALNDLKVGTKIGKEWNVKKIITTNFGNNKSSFYELENREGRFKTLNKEEIKDLLKGSLSGKEEEKEETVQKREEKKLPDLSPPKEVKTEEAKPSAENKESKIARFIPKINLPKPGIREETPVQKPFNPTSSTSPLNLNPEQIELIKTIHQNQKEWKTFTSLSGAQWEKVSQLYEQGRLNEIGIDANPLTDFLDNPDIGSLIEVKKGETFGEILKKNDYKIAMSKADAPVFGVHVIANRKILEEARKKVEDSGISVAPFPSNKEIINLVTSAQNGNSEALANLIEFLQFIPINQRVKIISKEDIEKLSKYFK